MALPIRFVPERGSARLVVGEANRVAIQALDDPSAWPFRTALLVGPPRSGRSSLAAWFAARGRGEAIDDADARDDAEVFHRWNRAQESATPLLLVAREGWDIALPDLRSRLGAAQPLALRAPDDAMVPALMQAHAARLGLALGEGAIAYLAPRVTRSYAAIEALVAAIDRLTLERKAPPTLAIWREALEAVEGVDQPSLF